MSSPTAVFEHAYYIGGQFATILYGVQLVLFFATLRAFRRNSDARHRKSDRFFAVYSTVMTLLVTVDVATNAVWGEQMWITSRAQPGGVEGFIATETSVWYETLSSTSVVALIFMSDALLIYRAFVLFASNYFIIVLPVLIYLAAFALAIIELVIAGTPNGNFFGTRAASFGVPYYALTISLNTLLTLLIVARLLTLARAARASMGAPAARLYTGVAALMAESAAPYAALGIMFLVPYARGSDTSIAFGQVWAKVTCIAPTLIIYRVLTRRAWDAGTVSALTGERKHAGAGVESTAMEFVSGALETGVSSTAKGSKSQIGVISKMSEKDVETGYGSSREELTPV
ncbi:uncharacterized protein B0H18DRAFT_986537 [Fomitopsis serialis]|uniref:uncharacterized protein n=1 Tax=Fomitopsis serialis TaxID=139415 RepID=UPI002007AA9C|nr:uncharacterized protein B0H18DRAFT_986537 [Neoantrodia serialis]KAH9932602.1 hypothetical protein B0H18DRAFT_986537 [Neoantrodia serialis]